MLSPTALLHHLLVILFKRLEQSDIVGGTEKKVFYEHREGEVHYAFEELVDYFLALDPVGS